MGKKWGDHQNKCPLFSFLFESYEVRKVTATARNLLCVPTVIVLLSALQRQGSSDIVVL